jgi:osmoprotectant transport system ATP-binding protein
VIQDAGLFPHFTVARNVGLVPTLEGWDESRVSLRVEELLHLVGLVPERFASRFPSELSGGQRQRVGVARALAADPPLLLMDEPFGALDPLTRSALQREFAALQSRLGKTVIFVTHDVREALLVGTRVALMSAGRVLLLDTPEAFLRSEEPLARAYRETLRTPWEVSPGAGGDA